jgi:hypothetical protein
LIKSSTCFVKLTIITSILLFLIQSSYATNESCRASDIVNDPLRIELLADGVAHQLFNFNFVNYEEKLNSASSLLSDNSFVIYKKFLQRNKLIENVVNKKLLIYALNTNDPKLLSQSSTNFNKSWKIEVPLQLVRQSASDKNNSMDLSILFFVESKKPFNTLSVKVLDIHLKNPKEKNIQLTSYLNKINYLPCDTSQKEINAGMSDDIATIWANNALNGLLKNKNISKYSNEHINLKDAVKKYYALSDNEQIKLSFQDKYPVTQVLAEKREVNNKYSWLLISPIIKAVYLKGNVLENKQFYIKFLISRSNAKNVLLGLEIKKFQIIDENTEAMKIENTLAEATEYNKARDTSISNVGESNLFNKINLLSLPIDKAGVSDDIIQQFARDASIKSYTYSFKTYKQNRSKLKSYFTSDGWLKFKDALNRSNNLEAVIKKQFAVSAKSLEKPKIINKFLDSKGFYTWKVEIPVKVSFYSKENISVQNSLITILIQRTFDKNTQGIGVTQFVASPFDTLLLNKP